MAVPQRGFHEGTAELVQFGKYLLLDQLGESRIGTVHRACLRRDGRPDKLFAIKRVSAELSSDRGFAERFVEVMTRATRVEHPSHCSIEDVDWSEDGSVFAAMSLVAGKDLARIAAHLNERGEVMPPQLVAYIGAQIADVLAAAHGLSRVDGPAPLYHGELSPIDILIGYDGRVQLTGLGSVALQAALPMPTARLNYQSPELVLGAPCTPRSDVFSLGACLYELLSGSPALADARRASATRRPESHIRQLIPRALEQIVSRALAEQPHARWQNAAIMAHTLRRWCASHPVQGDASALASFMRSLFETECSDEAARLATLLAKLPAPSASAATPLPPAAGPRPGYAQLVRASQRPSPRPNSIVRPDSERVLMRTPALPPPPPALQHDWTDPSEQTPARDILMRQLAAEMIVERTEDKVEDVDVSTEIVLEDPGAEPADEADDGNWDDDTSASGWIAPSEEQVAAVSPRIEPIKPALPIKPPLPTKPQLSKPPQLPRSLWPSVPAPAPPSSNMLPASAFAEPSVSRRSVAERLALPPRFVVPAIAAGALALLLAGLALFHRAGAGLSTLYVQSHPAGAEVLLRGERLGMAPLKQTDIKSGAALLELRAPGFDPVTYTLELKPGEAVHLEADLIRHTDPIVTRTPAAEDGNEKAELTRAREEQASARGSDESASERGGARRHRAAGGRDTAHPEPLKITPSAADEGSTAEVVSAAPSPEVAPPSPTPSLSVIPVAAESAAAPLAAPKPPASKVAASSAEPTITREPRGETRAAVLIERATPRFPSRAKRLEITHGFVTIEFTIDRTGAVTKAAVVEANPAGVFDDNALQAIQKWKYRPKLESGVAVESRQRFTFRFTE